MTAGTCLKQINLEARSRRSPAMSSYCVSRPPSGRSTSSRVTVKGCKRPYCRMLSASDFNPSSLNSRRGWDGLGLILSTSIQKIESYLVGTYFASSFIVENISQVPGERLELSRLSTMGLESIASTNSAIPACWYPNAFPRLTECLNAFSYTHFPRPLLLLL